MGKPAEGQAKRRGNSTPADLAAEIVRRAGGRAVVHLSEPPTPIERLQLLAARLEGKPVAIMPRPFKSLEEWDQYAAKVLGGISGQRNGPTGPTRGVPSGKAGGGLAP
jgi:hypothetical protein